MGHIPPEIFSAPHEILGVDKNYITSHWYDPATHSTVCPVFFGVFEKLEAQTTKHSKETPKNIANFLKTSQTFWKTHKKPPKNTPRKHHKTAHLLYLGTPSPPEMLYLKCYGAVGQILESIRMFNDDFRLAGYSTIVVPKMIINVVVSLSHKL